MHKVYILAYSFIKYINIEFYIKWRVFSFPNVSHCSFVDVKGTFF